MRIWIVNHYALLPAQSGGTRHYELARALKRLDHEPLIVGAGRHHVSDRSWVPDGTPSVRMLVENVPFHWIATPTSSPRYAARIWNNIVFSYRLLCLRGLRQEPGPEVVLGTSPDLLSAFSAYLVARRLRVPFILEIRDVWPQSAVEIGNFSKWHPFIVFLSLLERFLYRHADWIVTLLPGAVEHIGARGGDPARVTWIPNGIDSEQPQPPRPPQPAQGALFRLVYAGTFGPANSLDTLIEAARILRDRDQHAGLEICLRGDGALRPQLEQKVCRLGLDFVRFEPWVPKYQIAETLAAADAFVICFRDRQLYRWGVSANKIFDYMAASRPILIALSADYNPVAEADAGLTVPAEDPEVLADGIRRLQEMPAADRQAMGVRGYQYVKKFHSFEELGGRLSMIMSKLVREASPGSDPSSQSKSTAADL